MNEGTRMLIGVVSVVLLVVGIPAGCTAHQNTMMADAIKAGANPILVACAYRSDGKDPLCMEAVRGAK